MLLLCLCVIFIMTAGIIGGVMYSRACKRNDDIAVERMKRYNSKRR